MRSSTQEAVKLLRRRSNGGAETPDWFFTAVGHRPDHLDVDVDGCRIHVRAWGEPANPPLVLVHGGGAHSAWWDHIGPFFTHTHRVIAPDLSGHGDSDTRSVYGWGIWAREVLAAADAASVSGTVRIAGHSIGGQVAATAALEYGNQVDSIVVIDSPLRGRDAEISRSIERWSPVAAQEVVLPYVSAHIVTQSLHKASSGRRWELGAGAVDGPLAEGAPEDLEVMETMMAQMACRVAYVHCEAGLVPPAMATQIQSIMQLRGPFIELAQAGHHPMLDQPLPLIATLRTLLEVWSITYRHPDSRHVDRWVVQSARENRELTRHIQPGAKASEGAPQIPMKCEGRADASTNVLGAARGHLGSGEPGGFARGGGRR